MRTSKKLILVVWVLVFCVGAAVLIPVFRANKASKLANQYPEAEGVQKEEPKSLRPAIEYDEVDTRWRAVEALGETGDSHAIEPLTIALKDNRRVRYREIEALEKTGDIPQVVELLISALKDEDMVLPGVMDYLHSEDLLLIEETLVKIGQPAVEPLISALEYENNNYARMKAVKILGKLGDNQALEPLITALQDDNSDIRWRAAKALGELGDSSAIEPLTIALKDKDRRVRYRAIEALDKIGDIQIVEALISVLKDEDSYVQAKALKVLGNIEYNQEIEYFISTLKNEKEQLVRLKAAEFVCEIRDSRVREALENTGDSRIIEPLISALKDEDMDVRERVVGALVKIGKPAVEPLISALEHEDNNYARLKAVEILGMIGDERAANLLVAALKDEDPSVRTEAQKALVKISKPTVESLISALKDKDNYVRLEAAKLLGEIRDQRAVEPLINILNDKDKRVRYRALEALDKIGNIQIVEPLIPVLKDKDMYIRAKAAEVLGKTSDKGVVEPLITALKDNEELVRMKAVEALGKIGDNRVIEPLIVTLKNENLDVQLKVAGVLRTITGENFGRDPDKWQKWWEQNKAKTPPPK